MVYLLFDERMALHRPVDSQSAGCTPSPTGTEEGDTTDEGFVFERPDRINAIMAALKTMQHQLELSKRSTTAATHETDFAANRRHCNYFQRLPCVPATQETIELVHSREHYNNMKQTSNMTDEALEDMVVDGDLYFNRHTFDAALLAAGGVVEAINAVTANHHHDAHSTRALAVVRPPGHHAEKNRAMGFCYFNNIAIGAKHALYTQRASRVFILDWDIHHGNGIQNLTYDDPNIFYLSIHRGGVREENGDFFYPGTGRSRETGTGRGVGTNLNVAWSKAGERNEDYAMAFQQVVLPAIRKFEPDLILIACGLDPAKGDLLGDCGLTPDMFWMMTETVSEEVGEDIPIVAALEGGYNLDVIADCTVAVALALLDEPWSDSFSLHTETMAERERQRIHNIILSHSASAVYQQIRKTDSGEARCVEEDDHKKSRAVHKSALACIPKSSRAFQKASQKKSPFRRQVLQKHPTPRLSRPMLLACDRYPQPSLRQRFLWPENPRLREVYR